MMGLNDLLPPSFCPPIFSTPSKISWANGKNSQHLPVPHFILVPSLGLSTSQTPILPRPNLETPSCSGHTLDPQWHYAYTRLISP